MTTPNRIAALRADSVRSVLYTAQHVLASGLADNVDSALVLAKQFVGAHVVGAHWAITRATVRTNWNGEHRDPIELCEFAAEIVATEGV